MAGPPGERRVVATLFADVVDSTALAERLGPDRSKFLFDEVVGLMAEQVRAFGGTVAQLTGDGLFAVFGAPVAHEDDSVRAVRAGRAIHEELGGYASEVAAAYGVQLTARVAVNTGPVVLVEERPDDQRYNALGDTANVAARLQAVAGAGGVAVGPETARQVARAFELEELGELELKGKSEPIRAFLVTAELEAGAPAPRTPFVGRESELGVLEGVVQDALEGSGAVVSVTGEPGIGKSRLVREACDRVAGLRVLSGHALSYTEPIPYWPVRDLIRDWLGLGVSDPEARIRLELKAALAATEADELYPFLAALLGLTLEPAAAGRLQQLSRDSVQQQTVDSVARVFGALAAEQPLCLVLEDLHWADDATLDLVEELMPLAEEEAVVLVLLHRSERDHRSWELAYEARRRLPHRFHELELRALDARASRELASGAAGAELPEELAALIAERAGGNPFFLEEALADLLERGALTRRDGHVELAVPSAVQEALQARLDRLDSATREVVNVAAVIGQSFGLQLLELVAPPDGLRGALSELQRLDLVVEERRRPAPEYRFRHGLVQEVAYSSLLEPRRRALHGAVGRALEGLHAGSLAEIFGLLAWHFAESDEPGLAVDYLHKAGDAARALYANEEAREFYRQALELMPDGDGRAREILLKLGLSHHLAFEFEQAASAYERAFALPSPPPRRAEPSAGIETLFMPLAGWNFAPGHAYMTAATWFGSHLFRGLLTLDAEMNVLPDTAEYFAVAPDGLTYRFRLREDAAWSDGVPVIAEDFAYTFREMRAKRVAASGLLASIESAVATDRSVLEIRLREPSGFFLYLMAAHYAFPWPRHRCEELGEAWSEPANIVGNGPYVLEAFDDEHATLRASDAWTGPRGNVGCASLPFSASENVPAWRRGRGDIVELYREVIEEDDVTRVEVAGGLSTWYLGFRSDRPPLDDELIRRALALALDADRTAGAGGAGREPIRGGGFLPIRMPGHSQRVGLPHDPKRARHLLAEAGHPGGRDLPELLIVVPDVEGGFDVAAYEQPFSDAWEPLGVRVRMERTPALEMDEHMERCDLWCNGWTADLPDPEVMLRQFVDTLPMCDAQITAFLDRLRSSRNQDERLQLCRDIDRMLVAERVAIIPLHYERNLLVSRPWIHGFDPHPLIIAAPLDWLTVDEEARNKALARQT